jgi:hypothetical protein
MRKPKDVIAHLRLGRALANKFGAQGYEAPVTPTERAFLNELCLMRDEGWFHSEYQTKELRQAAGLRPSDLGMLLGRLQHDDVIADPTTAILETVAHFNGMQNNPTT